MCLSKTCQPKVGKNQISIGDVIRVLEIFKNYKYQIVTNKNYNSFFKKFNGKKIITFSQFKNQKNQGQNIINLVVGEKKDRAVFDVNRYISKKIDKISTFDLFKKLNKFKKNNKLNPIKKKIYKVGINWIVPQPWKIKSYPKKKWKEVMETLNNYKNVKISLQNKVPLNKYVTWIKSCDIIISVVGLGVHIARYFNKKIIVLVGPTDFLESENDPLFNKILPKKRCYIHKKKLNVYYKKCKCMQNIEENKIINQVLKITNGK